MNEPEFDEKKVYSTAHHAMSYVVSLGLILLFTVVVVVEYFPFRQGNINEDIISDRYARLSENQAKQTQLISTYEWVDQTEGVVRIPIEQAMKLTVDALQEKEDLR